MSSLVTFTGLMVAIMGIAWNEKWYTKLAQGIGGALIAAFPIVMYFVFGVPL